MPSTQSCLQLGLAMVMSALSLGADPAIRSASDLAHAPDGSSLAVLDATARELLILDSRSHEVRRRVSLPAPPSGIAWSADSSSVWISLQGACRIEQRHAATGALEGSFDCGRYADGLAHAPKRQLLLAADRGLNRLTIINLSDGRSHHVPAGCQPTSVAISPDESIAVVTALLPSGAADAPDHAADITIVDLQSYRETASIRLPLGSTGVREVAVTPDSRYAFIAHVVGRYNLPTTQLDRGWVNTNALSVIDLKERRLAGTLLLDQVMKGAADPWGVAIHPSEPLLYVTLSGVHELAVIDLTVVPGLLEEFGDALVNDLAALQRVRGIQRIPLPAMGPRGISVAPDGASVAIAGYFSGNVVITTPHGSSVKNLSLGPQSPASNERVGEMVYHDASRCFQTWLSCATCHPDARADGLNWDLLNDGIGNPKNARTMLWSDRTPPLMSLGVRSDMEAAVRAGFIHIQFSQPDDERVARVMDYFRSLEPAVSPYRSADGSLTESAARGKALYHSNKVGCARCHPTPLLTNLKQLDVGTSLPNDQGAHKFDTPSLVELWRTPPYLHQGQAATVREVLTTHNPNDKHGKTSHLSQGEIDDLVAYLLSL